MQPKLLDILACPRCHTALTCREMNVAPDGEILEGRLACADCAAEYPIRNGIPRFVPPDNYASSFGYQWNRFKRVQLDTSNGSEQSRDRFLTETKWTPEWMRDKWMLDAGCGAGRFLDVASTFDLEVVGVDISDAVDASRENLGDRRNVHLVQASLFELPFRADSFDACYCIGVLQHTPDPERALAALPIVLKPDGRIAVTIYERRRFTLFNGKYLVRPLTRRLNDRLLLGFIRAVMPLAFPLTEVLFRLPIVGKVFRFVIPIANYVEKKDLSMRQRYEWAVLDTFDMLSPRYDQPQKDAVTRQVLARSGITEIERTAAVGLNLVGRKRSSNDGR